MGQWIKHQGHSSKKHINVFGKQYDLCHLVFSLKLLVKKSPWYVSETYGKYSMFMLVLSQNHGTEFIYILFNKEYGGIMLISQMFPRAFGFFPRIFRTQPALGNIRWSLIFWQLNINNHVQIITFFQTLLAFKVM